jgi:hypothetical protein
MIHSAGFAIDRVSHYNWEQNPFGWLQSMLNLATGTDNSLFDVIRGGAAVNGRRRLMGAAALVTTPVLVPLALGLAFAESAARRGGTVAVWATK